MAVVVSAVPHYVPRALLPRVSTIWPLDLSQPGGWLVDRQIRELDPDPALCQRVLDVPFVSSSAVGDRPVVAGCGWSNAVHIVSVAGIGVDLPVARCGLSAALAMWLEHVVQPLALDHLGQKVARLEHLGSFACRNIRGNFARAAHRSQHASANAIDVRGFQLADGRRVRVKTHWDAQSPEGRFLAAVHAGACGYFRVVLGPRYNAAHHDHFHFDRGRWRACR